MKASPAVRSPHLSDDEWAVVVEFLALDADSASRTRAGHAFWEDTYANDHNLLDNFKRLAWVGDRVLNLALADRRDQCTEPRKAWDGTSSQAMDQSQLEAVGVWRSWPEAVRELLRLGNAKQGVANDRIVGTCAEAVIGLLFRERGYDAARQFIWKYWHYSDGSPKGGSWGPDVDE